MIIVKKPLVKLIILSHSTVIYKPMVGTMKSSIGEKNINFMVI